MADCGCPVGPHDPGCYCGARPVCEGFVDYCLLPFLKSGCGACLINYVTKPLWLGCDAISGRDSKDPERPSAVNAAQAVVVLTIRPVKNVALYKQAFGKYATKVQASNPGVRAFFSFIDKKREKTVLQVAWYDSPEVLAAIPKDSNVEACYAPATSGTAFGAVFGNRNDVVKKLLASTGVAPFWALG